MAIIFATILAVLGIGGAITFAAIWFTEFQRRQAIELELRTINAKLQPQIDSLTVERDVLADRAARLRKFSVVVDADDAAKKLLAKAQNRIDQALEELSRRQKATSQQAELTIKESQQRGKEIIRAAEGTLAASRQQAAQIINDAQQRAQEIAGEAYEVLKSKALYERTIQALRNKIEGYGDEYLKPADSFLDELAESFSHKEAGEQLKQARLHTKRLVVDGKAGQCEYVEASRREGAIQFVVHAFNGSVDSILSRVRHDNAGKLEQEIRDAYAMVVFGGQAFRNARVTDEYLEARLDELKWAVATQHLRQQEQEEQRRVRDRIREEEKVRREYERAAKQAAKEEDLIRSAMAKAEAAALAASAEQKAQFDAQLIELSQKLKEAEERNRRAVSMAEQTRRGCVYIISNVGSFGEHVYKVGLTRRLDPMDRIWELGDSSVPFDFDVHAFIQSDDAPKLEHELHKLFVLKQVNKVNHRKEFFRASLAEIRTEIEKLGLQASWTMTAEAREWRESQQIEKRIADDPVAREAWMNRQLMLDALPTFDDQEEVPATRGADLTSLAENDLAAHVAGASVMHPAIVE